MTDPQVTDTLESGVAGVPVEPGDHICALYVNQEERDQLPFLRAGLQAGHTCFCVVDSSPTSQVLDELGDGIETKNALAQRQLELFHERLALGFQLCKHVLGKLAKVLVGAVAQNVARLVNAGISLFDSCFHTLDLPLLNIEIGCHRLIQEIRGRWRLHVFSLGGRRKLTGIRLPEGATNFNRPPVALEF